MRRQHRIYFQQWDAKGRVHVKTFRPSDHRPPTEPPAAGEVVHIARVPYQELPSDEATALRCWRQASYGHWPDTWAVRAHVSPCYLYVNNGSGWSQQGHLRDTRGVWVRDNQRSRPDMDVEVRKMVARAMSYAGAVSEVA